MAEGYDAILIGAGHNALACGMHLATKGWRIGIFEQAPEPGGAVKTGEYTLPGFRHDWAAMNLSLFAGSPFFKAHGAELMRHGLAFAPVTHPFASVFPDGRWLGVSTDAEATIARIASFSPEDGETWAQLVQAFPGEAETIFGLLGNPMKLRALAYFMFKILRRRGVPGTLDLAQFLSLSPRQWLTQTFVSPQMHAMLGAWGMHLDFAPDVAGGGLFPYLEGMAGQAFGMALGKGGADIIVRAMVAAIRARGGTVECGAKVCEILHTNGQTRAIRLQDGREVTAGRAVIAGVAPGALSALAGPMSPTFDRAMKGFVHAPGTMMIHLALDGLPDWTAGEPLQRFAYVHLAPSLDQMARTYAQAQAGLLPDEPVVVVGQPTAIDPARAPYGKHILWVQVRMVPAQIRGDAAGTIAGTDWKTVADPFAERIFTILARYAPGIRAKIIGQKVVTPLDLQADNPNLVGGDQLCGSHHLHQNFLFRPTRGHADGSTPIRKLHLTGAAVWPGAGTGAGSGYLLARQLAGN